MRAALTILGLLLAAPAAIHPSPPAEGNGAPCATAVEGMEKLADTTSVVPQFVFDGRLEIDRLLVCEEGVYFFFRAREWGRYMRFCYVIEMPTPEKRAACYGGDETDPQKRAQAILAETAVAKVAYDEFMSRFRDILGKKFAEGEMISFEKSRWRPILTMKLGDPMRFQWRKRTVDFYGWPQIYYVPPAGARGWTLFFLLYTGAAHGAP
jgi:hypothetical protein